MELSLDDIDRPSLKKADLCANLIDRLGVNKSEAADMVDAFFDTISKRLAAGDAVGLSGFGIFGVKAKAASLGRNPKTGASAKISSRRVVIFQASTKLKERLNNGKMHRVVE